MQSSCHYQKLANVFFLRPMCPFYRVFIDILLIFWRFPGVSAILLFVVSKH
jgi:hypothetical protein